MLALPRFASSPSCPTIVAASRTHSLAEVLRLSLLLPGRLCSSAAAALLRNQSSAGSLQATTSHTCFAPLPPGPAYSKLALLCSPLLLRAPLL